MNCAVFAKVVGHIRVHSIMRDVMRDIMWDIMRDVQSQRSRYSMRPRDGYLLLLLCGMRVKPYPPTYPCQRQYIYIYICNNMYDVVLYLRSRACYLQLKSRKLV